jgi:hypothetical protein
LSASVFIPSPLQHHTPPQQGHVVSNWKHRFCVLTRDTIFYFKEEPSRGDETPAGGIELKGALAYPETWAPKGLFGWMLRTNQGTSFPLR